ncbi:MAG: FAD-dependent oxidoreductase [Candidatus Freyrarchaeum guaymaensis]|nr:FAD-dependent oxidoreductase [Candidatus Freyarchaeota archaeon]
MREDEYDVIVIGGGSSGAGTARDCAMRGLKTILLERNDFGSGTAGACAGMISGGVKYLNEPEMVAMCTQEVVYLQRIAKHIVFRLPIITAIVNEIDLKARTSSKTDYSQYTAQRGASPIMLLSTEEARKIEPKLSDKILLAAYLDEMFIDPFRLCLLNALSAKNHGADVRNYTEVIDVIREGDRVKGVRVRDKRTGTVEEIRGKIVANCAGPWVPRISKMAGINQPLRLNKGSHIVFDRRITGVGVVCRALDGRSAYLFPHFDTTILGTTAWDIFGNPDDAETSYDDVEYLISSMEVAVPSIREARIIRTMCGVRPMIPEWWVSEDDATRNFRLVDHEERDGVSGLVSFEGGKLVIYRIMAEKMTDLICQKLGVDAECRTHIEPLPGAEGEIDIERWAEEYNMPTHTVGRIASRHGSNTPEVLKLTRENPEYRSTLCVCESVTEAEIRYSLRNEFATCLSDLRRRVRLGMGPCQGTFCTFKALAVIADELGLTPEQAHRNAIEFAQERWKGKRVILRGDQVSEEELNQAIYAGVANYDSLPNCWRRD